MLTSAKWPKKVAKSDQPTTQSPKRFDQNPLLFLKSDQNLATKSSLYVLKLVSITLFSVSSNAQIYASGSNSKPLCALIYTLKNTSCGALKYAFSVFRNKSQVTFSAVFKVVVDM